MWLLLNALKKRSLLYLHYFKCYTLQGSCGCSILQDLLPADVLNEDYVFHVIHTHYVAMGYWMHPPWPPKNWKKLLRIFSNSDPPLRNRKNTFFFFFPQIEDFIIHIWCTPNRLTDFIEAIESIPNFNILYFFFLSYSQIPSSLISWLPCTWSYFTPFKPI